MTKFEKFTNYGSLIIAFIALLSTLWLTFNNIRYFDNQRNDTLNQQLYEKKITACIEILSSLDNFMGAIPSPLDLRENSKKSIMTGYEFIAINKKYDEYKRVSNKWEIVLPEIIILKINSISDEATELLLNYSKLQLQQLGDKAYFKKTIPSKLSLISKNLALTESLRIKRFDITNSMRANLGAEKLSAETLNILEK